MKISRRRFTQGLAATLVAAPLLRDPEPEVEPPFHWETVPDGRTRWDLPPEHQNSRCAWDSADANPLEDIREGIRRMREATGFEPDTLILSPSAANQIQGIVSGHAELDHGFRWTPDATITLPGMEAIRIRGLDANGNELEETITIG